MPGNPIIRLYASSRRRRSPCSMGARRRRMPASVELHVVFGTKGREHRLPLFIGETSQIQLIVIAQELSPLRGGLGCSWLL